MTLKKTTLFFKRHKLFTPGVYAVILSATFPVVASATGGIKSALSSALSTIMSLFAWLTGAMGVLMANVIYQTVVKMGSLVHSIPAIQSAWEVFRDLGNILLVFGFIFIGIATILDNATYGAKKTLPKLLMVALTLNFSFFIAGFIIDTGNMFATQFYTQINAGKMLTGSFNVSEEPISSSIMNAIGLTKIYDFETNTMNQSTPDTTNQDHWAVTFFASIILFIITAFTLGAIAIMLVIRFVILLILLMTSPVGFVGLAGIPIISKYGKKWWSTLTDQTLFAPVLLLLLLVVVKVIQSPAVLHFAANGNVSGGVTEIANILLGFSIVIGLVLSTLVMAKSLSGKTADFATKKSGALLFGLSARMGRGTFGWAGQRASERFRKSKLSRVPIIGHRFAGALDKVATSSFDVRATKTGGGLLRSQGIDAGKVKKGGYRKQEEEAIKKQDTYGKSLGLSEKEKEKEEAKNNKRNNLAKKDVEQKEARVKAIKKRQATETAEIDENIAKTLKTISFGKENGIDTSAQEKILEELRQQRSTMQTAQASELKTAENSSKAATMAFKQVGEDIKSHLGKDGRPSDAIAQERYAQRLKSHNTSAVANAGSGAALGAAIGTVVLPGIGTVIGSATGATLGARLGQLFGSTWRKKAASKISIEARQSDSDKVKLAIEKILKETPAEETADERKGEKEPD